MRSSRWVARVVVDERGIIPAHAGLTRQRLWCVAAERDHPRACGAHRPSTCAWNSSSGSSPRMRGSQARVRLVVQLLGIIPAHAGLTHYYRSCHCTCGDHPRACGAHYVRSQCTYTPEGSSPRMRGSRAREQVVGRARGIIPAHAGLTSTMLLATMPSRDHPRACGAHMHDENDVETRKGSSPRMRGSLVAAGTAKTDSGIIPAHAGLTE